MSPRGSVGFADPATKLISFPFKIKIWPSLDIPADPFDHRPRVSYLTALFTCGDVARSAAPAHAAILVQPVSSALATTVPALAPLPVFGPDDISTAIGVIKQAGAGSASEGWRRILK